MKKSFAFIEREKASPAQRSGINGDGQVSGSNCSNGRYDGGAWDDVEGQSKKSLEQDKLEQYFEALDATRKRHHKVQTDVLEVWFM